jgi:DNA-directed RNA polymerase subunit N (RpoN/RPB10)
VTATTVFVAEIACLLCGRVLGTAVDTRWPPVATVVIKLPGSATFQRLALDRLCCRECGGNTAPTEVRRRAIRGERPVDWQSDRRRLGRPPKWPVARRTARPLGEQRSG